MMTGSPKILSPGLSWWQRYLPRLKCLLSRTTTTTTKQQLRPIQLYALETSWSGRWHSRYKQLMKANNCAVYLQFFSYLELSNPRCSPDSLLNHEFNYIQVTGHSCMGHATLSGSNLAPHSITLTVCDLSSVQKKKEYCSVSEPGAFVTPSQDFDSAEFKLEELVRDEVVVLRRLQRGTAEKEKKNNTIKEVILSSLDLFLLNRCC